MCPILVFAVAVATAVASPALSDTVDAPRSAEARVDSSSMTLEGGKEGTLFESLRIEGEDRVRVGFERPSLDLVLESGNAPGLEWKSVDEVIARIGVDLIGPFLARSAGVRGGTVTRPWLDEFATDGVARFQPRVEGVDRWRLLVADSKGDTVPSFSGDGKPPKQIVWNGRSLDGSHATPGLVYSYVLEAHDRAGNKRNFVGEGFALPSYRVDDGDQHVLMFSGLDLSRTDGSYDREATTPAILLEIASWANQERDPRSQVLVSVTAREYRDAKFLADRVSAELSPLLLGDPKRVRTEARVEPDAAEHGSIAVVLTH
jgi:hypothetical protein